VEIVDYVVNHIWIAPTKRTYEYGEALNFTGGSLQIIFRAVGSTNVILADIENNYDPTAVGEQVVTVSLHGVSESFNVTVRAMTDAILTAGSTAVVIYMEQSLILLYSPKTTHEFLATLNSHLIPRLYYEGLEYEGDGTGLVNALFTLALYNAHGILILSAEIIVIGDLNFSGTFDACDMERLIEMYLDGPWRDRRVGSIDGTEFSLTHLVQWIRRLNKGDAKAESAPQSAQEFFSLLISEIRKRAYV
jgi:hypothetical protein